jgi:hypothetical protein
MKNLFLIAVMALGLVDMTLPSQAQSYGLPGGSLVSAMPASSAYGTNWIIGTTNATISPIYVGNCRNVNWEVNGACTNTTSSGAILFALFNDMSSATWWLVASNASQTATRLMTIPWTGVLQTISTNYDVSSYQWMVPLYYTNSAQCVTGATLRYSMKPGF